ncbi:MAG: barstar family protein [Rhodocyclaceae bacterium]|nr:barstar family protein [Rhodocyclaceae bacterium]MBX3670330.1 barstar family protein [Rhodocyclaceae bacterium]
MQPSPLATRLRDASRAGVFYGQPSALGRAQRASLEVGITIINVDLRAVTDKAGLMAAMASAFSLPDWFGHNWDALADCLADLSWKEADGYAVFLHGAAKARERMPDDLDEAVSVLRGAVEHWRSEGLPFWVLFDAPLPDLISLFAGT